MGMLRDKAGRNVRTGEVSTSTRAEKIVTCLENQELELLSCGSQRLSK